MFDKLIKNYLNKLIDNNIIEESRYEMYEYKLICWLESLFVIISLLIVGLICHCMINCVAFIVCFFSIRNHTGGFHLDSLWKCYIGTMLIEVLGILLITRMSDFANVALCIFCIVAYVIIMIIGTLNHPNINMNETELILSKKMARTIASLFFLLILFMKWIQAANETILFLEYAMTICGGLVLLGRVCGQYIKEKKN